MPINKNYFVLIFIALALTVPQFYSAQRAVLYGAHSEYKIGTFAGLEVCKAGSVESIVSDYKRMVPLPAWRARILSNWAISWLINSEFPPISTRGEFASRAASWHSAWIFATLLLLIFFTRNKLLNIFGFSACLAYAWIPSINPGASDLLFPWDAPTIFFWTALLLLRDKRFKNIFRALMFVSVGFTETTILFFTIPLFYSSMALKDRLKYSAVCLAAGVLMKVLCDILVGNPIPLFNFSTHCDAVNMYGHYWNIGQNLWLITLPHINSVLFGACGIWLAIFLNRPKKVTVFKVLALEYMVFLLVSGVMSELRLWQIFIPLFFIGIEGSEV
jgi:hypothetical protein